MATGVYPQRVEVAVAPPQLIPMHGRQRCGRRCLALSGAAEPTPLPSPVMPKLANIC
jgi:hypothetical protein